MRRSFGEPWLGSGSSPELRGAMAGLGVVAAGLSTPTAPRAQSFHFSATRISGWKVLSWKFWWSRFFS